MQIIGVVFFGIFTLLSGPIADAIGRRKLLLWVTGAHHRVRTHASTLFLLPQADPKFTGALTQAFLVFGFMLMGATFGPMGALLPELFPTNVRYTGSAISYNVSSILGAALAPIVAVGCGRPADGSPWLVGVYLSAMGVLTFIALLLSHGDEGHRLRRQTSGSGSRPGRCDRATAQSRNSARSRFVVKTSPTAIMTT